MGLLTDIWDKTKAAVKASNQIINGPPADGFSPEATALMLEWMRITEPPELDPATVKRYFGENSGFDGVSNANPNGKDAEGNTLLTLACAFQPASIVDALLEVGADPNIPNNKGWTPLMYAAQRGDKNMTNLLLEAHADITHKGPEGLTAWKVASRTDKFNFWFAKRIEGMPPPPVIIEALVAKTPVTIMKTLKFRAPAGSA